MDLKLYALLRGYVKETVEGAGAIKGKSNYEIAVEQGFKGSESEWLRSLQGTSPSIGKNGNWFIGDVDTGVIASPDLVGYAKQEDIAKAIQEINLSNYATLAELQNAINSIPKVDLTEYATKAYVQELIDAIEMPEGTIGMAALTKQEILDICK